MFRRARIALRNVLINISIGDIDMLTIRFDALSIDADSSMEDISSDALNKIGRVEGLAVALNGRDILETTGSSDRGINLTCNARIFQGSVSLSLDVPEKTKITIRDTNIFDIVRLLFEQQKTLAPFKPPASAGALESLRIEYLYMLENPSPNWTDRKRFIELSVNPLIVANWRRQISRNSGINVRDLFTSISNIGSPDRTPPTNSEESQMMAGPLKIDFRLLDTVFALELPNSADFTLDISKLIVSLVFPVGRNTEEFTGRFIFSKVRATINEDKLVAFDMSMTLLRSLADGFDYDFTLKHDPAGLQLTPRVIRNLTDIIVALPTKTTAECSVDSVMENVQFLARDLKESRVQLKVDPLDIHVALTDNSEPVVFRIGSWDCSYSYTGGLKAKSDPVTISEAGSAIASVPAVQIVTDDDGVTSFFFAGSIEAERFPRSLIPQQFEIHPDLLDSRELRFSHGLFYRILRLFNLHNLVLNAPLIKIANNSLEHVQVEVVLSHEGFDILGSVSSCAINDEVLRTLKIDPIPSKPNKVVTVRASHMGTTNQTPICIETGPVSLSVDLPSETKSAMDDSSVINLIEALKPMVDLDIPKITLSIQSNFDICKLRTERLRFSKGCLEIGKLDCELPDTESIINKVRDEPNTTRFDPSNILPPIHVRELYVMGRFNRLNEDVVVGCTNFAHSGNTHYSASHVFVSTEAGCILELRNIKANRYQAESVDSVVINLSRQLIQFLEGIIESVPKPESGEASAAVPYKLSLSSVHFNFRDEHIISHVDLGMDVAINVELDGSKHVVTITESSKLAVRKIELKELHTNTLVLRNDARLAEALHVDFSGKVLIPTDESACVVVNFAHIDLRNGLKLILEDINEIKRLFELIPKNLNRSRPKRAIDLNCAIGILDPITVTVYSSGRPILSTEVQAGLISVFHSMIPNIRSISKILIPEVKMRAIVRNLKHGSWESLLQDSGFSLEVSEFRDPKAPDGGSLKVNLTGLGEVGVGLTPHTVACVRALTESIRDTTLEATGSDTFHVVNLIDRVIEFRRDSNVLLVSPRNSAVVADSIIMKDEDGIELINFRILDTATRPSVSSSLFRDQSVQDGPDWTIVDVTGSSDIVMDELDLRIQIVYNIELNKKLIVFSFEKILRNESQMPLSLQIHTGTNSNKAVGVPFALQSLSDGYMWFKSSRRGSLEDTLNLSNSKNEIVLMHKEAVSVSKFARFSIMPYGSSDFGYSSPLPVSLPTNGQYGLCCQPTSDTHALPLYVRIDLSDTEASGGIHLRPCGMIINNLPCSVDVEVVSSEGILYIESEQITRNSRRVLYNIDLSYCRVRLRTATDGMYSDWSENIYFGGDTDGATLRFSVRNPTTGLISDFTLTYSTNSVTKSVSFFHSFWLSNCTDVNVIPLIKSNEKQIESIQLGQEGLWYIQPEFDRKLNSLAVTLMRPHSAGSLVSTEAIPIDGSFSMMTDSFCLFDPMVMHADTIRSNDESLEMEPRLMDYTLFSVLPRFIVENTMSEKVIILRQFGGGSEYTLSGGDKISFTLSSLEGSPDIQFKIDGVSRWSRFALALNVDGIHSIFVLSDASTETAEALYPIPVSVRVETVRGITYVRLCDDRNPVYVVENRCPYIHSVIALAPKLRIGIVDDKSVDEIVFSPSPDDDKKTPIYFENTDRKVIRLMICFDESSRFKEVELDISQFTNVLGEAIKAKESIMNARQPILVPCQGYPVVMVSVVRSLSNPSQIVVAITPKDTSMSNWLGDQSDTTGYENSGLTLAAGKASVSVSLPRLKLNVCDSFAFYFDEVTLKISKKKMDEFSINELFAKSILAEQTRSEEQVIFATVGSEKGLLGTADRVAHPSAVAGSPLSLSDVRIEFSPMELTISNSVLEDVEYVIASFKDALVDQKQLIMNSAAIIARSGTPYNLTVDIDSVLEMTRSVRLAEFHDLRVSEIMFHVWSELVYNRSKFISSEIRLILSIMSLSDTLKLDGAEIKLPSEHIFRKVWRGPSSQLLSTIGDIYKKSLAENAASFSVVASSNVLNVVGGGLFRSSRDKKVIKKSND